MGVGTDTVETYIPQFVPSGTFLHVAGIYDGSSMSIYANGGHFAANTRTTSVTTVPTNTVPLHIGADSAGGHLFTGIIDEVRLYDRALTFDEIVAIYNAGATARCTQ